MDAAYRVAEPAPEWLRGIADAAHGVLDRGLGVFAFQYDASDASALDVGPVQSAGETPIDAETLRRVSNGAGRDPAITRRFYRGGWQTALLSELDPEWPPPVVAELAQRVGFRDGLLLRAYDRSHRGVLVAALSRDRVPMPPRRRATLSRVAAHLAAAHRLRRRTGRDLERADAIFTPDGRREHAAPGLDAGPEIERRVRDLVRGRELRRESPERAVELWRALVSGQWSIFETMDTDGKHFLVARRNEPRLEDPRALTVAERPVALYAAWGHSQKLIAYELGIAESTVNQRLKSVLKKLGLHHRSELAGLFEEVPSEPGAANRAAGG
ncbi:MAG TPA: LuxR C-terminal-related transcriptional regulator [Polyangiaceae bacterium]|nr:LuxR C-terminal-related transcriptional regulator [Polyangiaceae bacterium]